MIENLLGNPDVYIHGAFYMAVLAAYLGGVLASFTPCVYPVIPITVAYIGARSSTSKTKGFLLSIIYVLGMAAVYTALGGFAALTGKLFGQIQTNPWVPQFLTRFRPEEKSGGFVGSFLVGAVSGLIIGPCTTPVLAVLLSLIAARQSAIFGMSLMFVFAIGMGTLLVIVGTFSGLLSSVPRSGVWMTRINKIFGWILIGMGEYFLLKAGGMLWL